MAGGSSGVTVRVDGAPFPVTAAEPFVFGRDDAPGVVGLDGDDMGISARAGSVEWAWNVWWVANLSGKRPLLLEIRAGGRPLVIDPGHRHAVTCDRVTVLVPGAIFTHVLEVIVPGSYTRHLRQSGSRTSTGTLLPDGPPLTDVDYDVLTALCRGYLESFPRRVEVPCSYAEAAAALGGRWTATRVRKRVERIKARFAAAGLYFDGPRANHDLATHLTVNALLTPVDLGRLTVRS
jgi:hypothetical protein